jgi:hypothetical protein
MLKLRIADFLVMALIFFSIPYLQVRNISVMALLAFFFACYCISTVYGILTYGIVTPSNMLFVYKYLVVFALFWVLWSLPLHPDKLIILQKASFGVYFFLVCWVFLWVVLRVRGVFHGNFRVSFPFSNMDDPLLSDAPLYSVVLSTCLTAYLFTPRTRGFAQTVRVVCVVGFTCGAILLSGSRTGLLSAGATFAIYAIRRLSQEAFSGRIRFKRSTMWIGLAFILLIAYFAIRASRISDANVLGLLSRAISFGGGDASSTARVEKATYAIQTVLGGPVLIGIGSQSTFHTWFDSTWPNVLINTGMLGVLSFLLIIYFVLRKAKERAREGGTMRAYVALEYMFINYLVSSISTESFLTTRGLIPFAVFSAIFYHTVMAGPDRQNTQESEIPFHELQIPEASKSAP